MQPGDWRPAPPALTPAVFTQWSAVTPFVLDKSAQFRPAAPPALTSAAHDKIDGTSDVLTNVTRSFNSYNAAASEPG
jgi:hypothetical protein